MYAFMHHHVLVISRKNTILLCLFVGMETIISHEELSRHGPLSKEKWTAINGVVYDVSSFVHPGGDSFIQKLMGKDGTSLYSSAHPKDLVQKVLSNKIIGKLTSETPQAQAQEDENRRKLLEGKPPLSTMLNTFDFEIIARKLLSEEAWYYYSTGADDEICLRENRAVFSRVRLRPRIMVNVEKIDTSTTICGCQTSLPLYLSATALGRLAHPDGEVAITRAAAKSNIIYMLPTLSSCSLDEMLNARSPDQIVFSQLYVNCDRTRTRDYVDELRRRGVRALFVTVDAPQLGRREKDIRSKFATVIADVQKTDEGIVRDEGVSRSISTFIDPSLSWKDASWLLEISKGMPVYLKGVQCVEDALLAFHYGFAGIVLSNHGGRQIDSARSGLEILAEVMPALRKLPQYNPETFQVFIDGGIRRGADIFKALALGARAVGIGRPTLYALASYGQHGVERLLKLFKEELEVTMRLMGTPTIEDINSSHILPHGLIQGHAGIIRDYLSERVYEPLLTQAEKDGYVKSKI